MKKAVFAVATLLGLFLAGGLAAQSLQPVGEAFTWNAELVALDENARTVTLKAPILTDRVSADFKSLKAGERITLRWSGYQDYADSIAQAIRSTGVKKAEDHFMFPVDYVSFDGIRRYVTFKVQMPENEITKIKSLKPGDWVTATSPQGAASERTPVTAIRPYVMSASAS